jgi:hypothetical protein
MRTITPEYRKAYLRGWRASARVADGALDRADRRGEPDAWYDGYHDEAAGREKWHLARCINHDQPDRCVLA